MWPFEVLVIAKRHVRALVDLTDEERLQFAEAVQEVTRRYDNLFETNFPYSKCAPFAGVSHGWLTRCRLRHPPSAARLHRGGGRDKLVPHALLPASAAVRDRSQVPRRIRADGRAAAGHHPGAGRCAAEGLWWRAVSQGTQLRGATMQLIYVMYKYYHYLSNLGPTSAKGGILIRALHPLLPGDDHSLHVVVILQQHPDGTAVSRHKREHLRPAEPDRFEDKRLGRKVHGGNDMGPDGELVQGRVLELVARVEANDAGHEGVGAKHAGRQRRHLVLGLLGVLARRRGRLDDVGAVLGVVALGGRPERVVRDEAAVVDAARVVQGGVVLEGVAHGHDGDLGREMISSEFRRG